MMRHKDTNAIYPPSEAYKRATQEMESPTKKRPQSGGPSPDKERIEIEDSVSLISSSKDILSGLFKENTK